MKTLQSLHPQNVWKHFYDISRIPRPSGFMRPITEFLLEFGKGLQLETFVDGAGNVVIRKPATPGMENRKGVILQAHMDMVPQQNSNGVHNFMEQPIDTYIDGDWVKARGTTLGADNGLGMASIMAVLEDKTLKHGPLEALITVNEETGMEGAFGLQNGVLKGEILLNLDSEDEGDLYIGCAGGVDVTAGCLYNRHNPPPESVALRLMLTGLRGGHSGLEINAGRANANKLMARFIYNQLNAGGVWLESWQGGNMRNAIPREAQAVMVVENSRKAEFLQAVARMQDDINREYEVTETPVSLSVEPAEMPMLVMTAEAGLRLTRAIYACQNGVIRMIPSMPDTVETSSNLAIVSIEKGEACVQILARSSNDGMKADLVAGLESCFCLAEMEVRQSGTYSGWQPDVNSPVLQVMKATYKAMFGVEPAVKVIHAGLECGIIGAAVPGLDMISFGPTLRSPHSPDERVYVPSVAKFHDFLIATLKNIPVG